MRLLALGLLILVWADPAHAAPAHVHGEARLEMVIDGDSLSVRLDSPLDGLLGFERRPRTEPERQAVRAMRARLETPDRLFLLPAGAACVAMPPRIASPVFVDGAASGHLDLSAEYHWRCARPAALRTLETRLFAEFPRLRMITVQFIGPGGQRSGRLTPRQAAFAW